MQIKFLNASAADEALRRFIAEYDEFHWAVAWGSMTDAAKELFRYPAKFRNVTFGVAFSQTDPDLVDELQGINGASVATKFAGGTYHPKVYCFRSEGKAAAVIGSANFTWGGLGKNWEAAICITGDAGEALFGQLFKFARDSARFGEPVTSEFASAYRASFKRASRMKKPPRDPMDGLRQIKPVGFASPLVSMNWAEYVEEINASTRATVQGVHHDVERSLSLLRIAQEWFASVPSFSDLSPAQRKAIAGIIGTKQKTSAELNRDWGWFGSMKGAGDFANRIDRNDGRLARALDSIPQKGEVTKHHFVTFVKHFKRAFDQSERMGGVATASRLLAMKRPDTFLCICKPNIAEASRRMGFSKTTLKLDDYWDKVVEVIRLSEWFNSDKPDDQQGQLWESRVAMLDVMLYRPD